MFRAKMQVVSVTEHIYGTPGSRNIKLQTQYDDTIAEDQRFFSATPNGTLEMLVNNPVVIEQCKPGKVFYMDFAEVPSPAGDGRVSCRD